MTRLLRASLVLAIVALAVALSLRPGEVSATTRLGTSPHDKPDACVACHAPGTDGRPGAPLPVVATCRSCHPDADMHPVGVAPHDTPVPAGWPLEDGKLSCATCHAEPSCSADRADVAPWFRGGNPDRTLDFCYRCHAPARLERSNPHLPTTEGGTDGCTACHSGRPEPGAAVAASRLRLAPAEACATCHPGPVHAGVVEHVGKVQTRALSAVAAAALPLDDGGTIACWTCHDVHAAGPSAALAHDGVAGRILAGRERPGGGTAPPEASAGRAPMLALSATDGTLCTACHGSGP